MFKGLGLFLLLILSSFGVYTIISKVKSSKKSLFDLGVVIPKILIPKNLAQPLGQQSQWTNTLKTKNIGKM